MSKTAKRLAVAAIIGSAACVAYYFLADKKTKNRISVSLKNGSDRLRRAFGARTKVARESSGGEVISSSISGNRSSASKIPFPESVSDDPVELRSEKGAFNCKTSEEESEDDDNRDGRTLEKFRGDGGNSFKEDTAECATRDGSSEDVSVKDISVPDSENDAVKDTGSAAVSLDVTAKLYDKDIIESAVVEVGESSEDDIPGLDIDKEVDKLFDESGAEDIKANSEDRYGDISTAFEGSAKKKEGRAVNEKIDRQRWLNL